MRGYINLYLAIIEKDEPGYEKADKKGNMVSYYGCHEYWIDRPAMKKIWHLIEDFHGNQRNMAGQSRWRKQTPSSW